MPFSVTIYNRNAVNSYVCRLMFRHDNFLQRKLQNGGYWEAVPQVFNISSGRFRHREPDELRPTGQSWLEIADSGRILFHKTTGRNRVLELYDFPMGARPGDKGKGRVLGLGVRVISGDPGDSIRWVVSNVDGQVPLFPSRNH